MKDRRFLIFKKQEVVLMENVKHTIAAGIAVVLISSLAAVQATDLGSLGSSKSVWDKEAVLMSSGSPEEVSVLEVSDSVVADEAKVIDLSQNSDTAETKTNVAETKETEKSTNETSQTEEKKAEQTPISGAITQTDDPAWNNAVINVADKVAAPAESTSPFVAAVTEGTIPETATTDTQTAVMGVSEEAVDPNVGYVILSEGSLNVRIAPSTDAEIVDQLDCAAKVNITEKLDSWYKVTYGEENNVGYVSSVSITNSKKEAEDARLKAFMYETGVAVVTEGALNVRSGIGTGFEVIDQLDNGEEVIVIERDCGWLKIYYGVNYNTGYVIADSIKMTGAISKEDVSGKQSERAEKTIKGKGKIAADGGVNVRSTPNETSSVITQIADGSKVSILETKEGWTKIAFDSNTVIGYVKSEFISEETDPTPAPKKEEKTTKSEKSTKSSSKSDSKSSSSSKSESSSSSKSSSSGKSSSKGQALVDEAKKYLGVKYVYGGSSPSGFDCSGLVQYVCRKNGISVSRSSRDQFSNGVAVSRDNLQPGDLVFFQKNGTIHHVGIYVGGGQMIHAPQTGKTVSYQSINTPGRIQGYAGARRVV